MIVEARELELTTRDVAPQPGEIVVMHRRRPTLAGEEIDRRNIRRAIAHWPVMGLWEVAVDGVRKDEITVMVAHAGSATWREVAGR